MNDDQRTGAVRVLASTNRSAPVTRFRADVEGLRGVAVLAVVCFHAGLVGTGGGFVGVDVFFVISGFLITGLLCKEMESTGRIAFGAFYGRRLRRLLPAAAVVLVVTTIVSAVVLSPLQARDVLHDAQSAALYVTNYRFAALRTNYLAGQAVSPLQHYWSLAVEEQFYLLWPLLMLGTAWIAARSGAAVRTTLAAMLGAVTIGSFALSVYLTRASQPWAFFSLPTRAWELGAGAAVALAVPALTRMPKGTAAFGGWCGVGAMIFAVRWFSATTPFPGTAALLPVGGAALILAGGCAAPARGASYALARPLLRRAGRISYSWYLWHWPVLILAPAVIGHSLNVTEKLALVALSALLATATVAIVENPVRFAPRLAGPPHLSLALGASLTVAMLVTIALVGTTLGPLRGARPAAAPAPLGRAQHSAHGPGRSAASFRARLVTTDPALLAAVAEGAATRAVPSNLDPSLADAHGDKARPFLDGCNATYSVTSVGHCTYGATRSATNVVLFGDSHATQWFPALDAIANLNHWRLIVADKSTCPPLELTVFSPVLGRTYNECGQFRRSALDRIRTEHPKIVILGVARHYSTDYHFSVYSDAWTSGLAAMVRDIRALGPQVVVMGPTPKPNLPDVPSCLSAHLADATACTTPTAVALNHRGITAERDAVEHAGGSYINIEPWVCTSISCAVIVGNLLVYRDDNHLTTTYVTWLTPALQDALNLATSGSAHR